MGVPDWAAWAAWRWSEGDLMGALALRLGVGRWAVSAAVEAWMRAFTGLPRKYDPWDRRYHVVFDGPRRRMIRQYFGGHATPPEPPLTPTSFRTEEERCLYAHELRVAGTRYKDIAARLHVSVARARRLVMGASARQSASWTKDYLVGGPFTGHYGGYSPDPPRRIDELQALYRVEHARRALKAARAYAPQLEEDRQRRERAALVDRERRAKRSAGLPPLPDAPVFASYAERNVWVGEHWRAGYTLQAIAERVGVRRERVRQIAAKDERRLQAEAKRAHTRHSIWMHSRANLGRPIDMGGPRDVWLEYTTPPDPRFDAMLPVVP